MCTMLLLGGARRMKSSLERELPARSGATRMVAFLSWAFPLKAQATYRLQTLLLERELPAPSGATRMVAFQGGVKSLVTRRCWAFSDLEVQATLRLPLSLTNPI